MPIKTRASDFKVSKDIPIPGKAILKEPRFPMHQLDIGDSFFAPLSLRLGTENTNDLRASINGYAHSAHIKITTRVVTENNVEGIRVWRVQKSDKGK